VKIFAGVAEHKLAFRYKKRSFVRTFACCYILPNYCIHAITSFAAICLHYLIGKGTASVVTRT